MIHNVINGNSGAGVSIDAIAIGSFTFQNNVINGNGQYEIFVAPPSPPFPTVFGLEVINNTSLANGMVDLFDGQLRIAAEPCGATTRSSRLIKVAFIEEPVKLGEIHWCSTRNMASDLAIRPRAMLQGVLQNLNTLLDQMSLGLA